MYIGKSITDDIISTKSRPYSHLHGKRSYSKLVFAAVQKYGIENFLVIILHKEDCTKEKLKGLEKCYIKHFKTRAPGGYNLTDGGDGGDTRVGMTIEQRIAYANKMSLSCKGINTGPRPIEIIEKIVATTKEAMKRPEVRNNWLQNNPSRKNELNSFYGKRHTDGSKKKMADSHKGKNYSNHIQHHFNKGILNLDCQHCIEQIMKEHS